MEAQIAIGDAGPHLPPPPAELLLASVEEYAIFAVDSNCRVASWNPGVKRILGFEADEFIGLPFESLLNPEESLTGDAGLHPNCCVRKDGKPVLARVAISPISKDGHAAGFAAIVRESRPEAASEVPLQSAEMHSIFESISDGVYIGDRSGIRQCNRRGLEMLGYDTVDQLNRDAGEVASEIETAFARTGEPMSREQLPFVRALAGQHAVEEVLTRNVRTGKTMVVRSSASPVWQDGRVVAAIAINTDITEQRAAEAERAALLAAERAARLEAEASARDYRFLAESIPEIVWSVDARGGGLYYSPRWYEYTGLSEEESLRNPWFEAVEPEQRENAQARWAESLVSGRTFEMEVRLRRRDGCYRWHFCRALARRGPDGAVASWTGVCTNVDELKRSEVVLKEAARMESIEALAGGIAHDFNNLLTCIVGNTSLVLQSLRGTDPAVPLLNAATSAAESAGRLTRQLLAYAGKGRAVAEKIQLPALIQSTRNLVQASIPSGVRLDVRIANLLPSIQADPAQIQQILLDLIMNGAEAIPAGSAGRVIVTARTRRIDEPFVSDGIRRFEVAPGLFVSLTVEDTGTGMTPGILGRIFEPFFTTKFMGRGLGLAAVIGMVRSYRGGILTSSKPGLGSCFEVLLPVAEPA